MALRVLIVDDDPGFRRVARAVLMARGHDVVGEAAGVDDGHTAVARLRPDVVLLDVNLLDGDGVALAAELRGGPRVLLTSTDSAAVAPDVVRDCGAAGFVAKTELALLDLEPYLRG